MLIFPPVFSVAASPVSVSFAARGESGSDLTAYTFSSTALGTASATRKIIVGASCQSSSSVARTVSTLTVAGNSASLISGAQVSIASGNYPSLEMWILSLASGTTGDIVVTWSGGAIRCGIGVWAVYDAGTPGTVGTSTASPLTASMNFSANGAGIAYAMSGSSASHSWTNLTEETGFDATVEGGMTHSGASALFASDQTGLSITDTVSAAGEQLMCVVPLPPA